MVSMSFTFPSTTDERQPITFHFYTRKPIFMDSKGLTGLPSKGAGVPVGLIEDAVFTTCDHPLEDTHYRLHAKRFIIYKNGAHYEFLADHMSLEAGGQRLFTAPKFTGRLSMGDDKNTNLPSVSTGTSRIDGDTCN
jgi:hypothetical protein